MQSIAKAKRDQVLAVEGENSSLNEQDAEPKSEEKSWYANTGKAEKFDMSKLNRDEKIALHHEIFEQAQKDLSEDKKEANTPDSQLFKEDIQDVLDEKSVNLASKQSLSRSRFPQDAMSSNLDEVNTEGWESEQAAGKKVLLDLNSASPF